MERVPGRPVPGRIGDGGGHGQITGVREKIHRLAKDGDGLRIHVDLDERRGVNRRTGRTHDSGSMHVDVVEGRVRKIESFQRVLSRVQTTQIPEAVLRIGADHVVR